MGIKKNNNKTNRTGNKDNLFISFPGTEDSDKIYAYGLAFDHKNQSTKGLDMLKGKYDELL